MVVTDQSSNLSMLSPSLWVYTPTSGLPTALGSVSSSAYGATVSYTVSNVQAGQTYLIREFGYSAGDTTGAFGLEVNFASASQAPISPPNTLVLQQPDQGGGSSDALTQGSTAPQRITIGNLSAEGNVYSMSASQGPIAGSMAVQTSSTSPSQTVTTDAVTPLVAATTAQTGLVAGKSTVTPASAAKASSAVSGSTPSTLQAIDAALLGWTPTNRLSAFTKANTKGFSLVA
jgi:hypothetical protein